MATVIDALIVTLGLDGKQYQQGQEAARKDLKRTSDEATRTAKEMEARGKQAAQFFVNMRNEALGLLTVLLGGRGLVAFTDHAVTSLADLGRTARNIGMSVPALAAFRNMIERNGGSADAAAASFQKLAEAQAYWRATGKPQNLAAMQALATVDPTLGPRSTPMQLFQDLAKFADRNSPQRTNLIGHMLGLDQDSINEALRGSTQVQKDIAESFRLGVPTKEMTERMQELQQSWFGLQQAAGNLANVILTELEPALNAVLKTITNFMVEHPGLAQIGAGAATAYGGYKAFKAVRAVKRGIQALLGGGAAAEAGGAGAGEAAAVTAAEGVGVGAAGVIGGAVVGSLIPNTSIQSGADESAALRNSPEYRNFLRPSPTTPARPAPLRMPRGIRNNNPGNLNFVGQPGSHLEHHVNARFAAFNTMAEGVGALAQQLRRYAARGVDTVRGIISKYAPPSENNTGAYIASVARALGVNPDAHLNLNSNSVLHQLIAAIAAIENGRGYLTDAQIDTGLAYGARRRFARNAPGSTRVETHVHGPITVNTKATDAKGVARGLGHAIETYAFASQANYGLS